MEKLSILVVEDETDIQELIEYNLLKNSFTPILANSGEEALDILQSREVDLMILDLMLPGINGFEVCKKCKKEPKLQELPIIMLTAMGEEEDIIKGFESGADDYITKPFSSKVLIARIRAVLRRKKSLVNKKNNLIKIHELSINPQKHEVLLANQLINLTNAEFNVLCLLASKPGWVQTRYQIIDKIKGENYDITDRAVDVLMVGLRKKMGDYGSYIETIRGVGYKFKDL
ncbi:MAG: response regulator [bacterium]